MSQADRSNAEFNRLFEQYSKKSDEELSEIIKPENGYTETAMRVASAVLQSDRSDYYQSIKRGEENEAEKEKAPPLRFDRDEAYLFVNSAVPPTFLPYDCTRANTLLFCNGNTRLCLPAAAFSKATRE